MLHCKVRDIKTSFTRNLYQNSTLQIIRQWSGDLVLPKSGIKPFLPCGLNEKTIFRPRLLDYLELKRCIRPSLEKRPNWVKSSLPVFRPKRRKNFTHSGGTYLSPGRQAGNSSFNLNTDRRKPKYDPGEFIALYRFPVVTTVPESVTTSYKEIIGNSVSRAIIVLLWLP